VAEEAHKEAHGEEVHGGSHGGGHGAAHGGAHEEHEGAPEWLISFADNVALMMGFFVILLAMNMKAPVAKGGIGSQDKNTGPSMTDLDFVIAMRDAFNPIDLDSDNPAEAALRKRIRERMANGTWRSKQPEDPGQGKINQATRPTELSNMGGTVPFEDDSDLLTSRSRTRVQEIAGRIKGHLFYIEVRGHASPSETYRDVNKGISLSFSRARAVAAELNAAGIDWAQMRLVVCGDNERNVQRDYSEADRLNQRVEVVVTGDRLPEPGTATGAGAGARGAVESREPVTSPIPPPDR
jgi:flagellar motor protein MotB